MKLTSELLEKYGSFLPRYNRMVLDSIYEHQIKHKSLTEKQIKYVKDLLNFAKEIKELKTISKLSIYQHSLKVKKIDRDPLDILKKTKYRGAGLYIIKFVTGVKIGVTSNLRYRVKTYLTACHQPIEKIYFLSDDTGNQFEGLEQFFKRKYQHLSLGKGYSLYRTEFFIGLSTKEIKKETKTYLENFDLDAKLKLIYRSKSCLNVVKK